LIDAVCIETSGDETICRMCREILNTCIRNTEEAENAQNDSSGGNSRGSGIGKGVWGMIEESSLARTIRLNDGKQVKHLFSPCQPTWV